MNTLEGCQKTHSVWWSSRDGGASCTCAQRTGGPEVSSLVGVWRVTHSVVAYRPPPPTHCDLPNYWKERFQNVKPHTTTQVRDHSDQGKKFDLVVIDDVTGQVKVEMFDCSGLMRLAINTYLYSGAHPRGGPGGPGPSPWDLPVTRFSRFLLLNY